MTMLVVVDDDDDEMEAVVELYYPKGSITKTPYHPTFMFHSNLTFI